MAMDAFQLINRIENLIETGNRVPLTRKVMLEEQALFDIIDQLRVSIPDDIKMAQSILQQRDSLLADAQADAQRILEQADREARERIEMSDFVQLAKQRADEVVHEADQQAQEMLRLAAQQAERQRQEADEYSLEVLRKVDSQLVALMTGLRKGIDTLEAQRMTRQASDQLRSPLPEG